MHLEDLPATLTARNSGDLPLGIVNLSIPAGGSVTVNLAAMAPAGKCIIWQALHAARLTGLITTSPETGPLDTVGLYAPTDGHDSHGSAWPSAEADSHDGFRAPPRELPAGSIAPEVLPALPPSTPGRLVAAAFRDAGNSPSMPSRLVAAFGDAGNSPYVPILLHT